MISLWSKVEEDNSVKWCLFKTVHDLPLYLGRYQMELNVLLTALLQNSNKTQINKSKL